MSDQTPDDFDRLVDGLTRAVEREVERKREPGWVKVARFLAGYQVVWGLFLAIAVDSSSTPSYKTMRSVSPFWMQGLTMIAIGVTSGTILHYARRRSLWRSFAGAIMGGSWGYVLGTLSMSNPATTAIPTYATIAGLCIWIVWGSVEDRHAGG